MKKSIKFILIFGGILVGIILLDSIQALIFNNNPIIGIQTKCMRKEGILVNTYYCEEGKQITKIKTFNSSCSNELVCGNDSKFIIVDKSSEIKNFTCDTALDPFYEDEKYIYSYGCIKSKYVVVKYNNGKEETVKDALNNKKISIKDLDLFNIKYYKQYKNNDNINKIDEVISSVKLTINGKEYKVQLEDNETVKSFVNLLPQEFNMNELNGNEKYVYLDNTLPTNSYSPKHIEIGDIMLYGNNCLVVFYKSFNTSYSYTKIGHIENLSDLGNKNVIIKFEK